MVALKIELNCYSLSPNTNEKPAETVMRVVTIVIEKKNNSLLACSMV